MYNKEQQTFEEAETDQKYYFENLKRNLKKKKPLQQASEVQSLIEGQIDHGKLNIKHNPQALSSIKRITKQIHRKSADFNKQLLQLNLKVRKGSHSVRGNSARSQQSFRSLYHRKAQVTQEQLKQYRKRQVDASKRLKRLKEEKQETNRIKTEKQKNKELQRLKQEAKILRIQQQMLKERQRSKTELIQRKMKQIQKRKQQRTQRLKNSRIKSTPSLPKFQEMRKKFQTEESEFNEIKLLKYKNSLKQKIIANNPINIRQHEQSYNDRMSRKISERSRIRTEQQSQSKVLEQNFNIRGRDQEEIKKKTQKWKKMHDFERNVSQRIRIKTNVQKQMQLEIAKDRINNPQKYNFLNQKALNDYIIYKEFDQFGLNINKKNLGNQYLKQVKDKLKQSKVKTVPNESSVSTKKIYKNYLIDARKNIKKTNETNEVDDILKKYGNKSDAVEALQQKSNEHTLKALEKIKKLQIIQSYENAIKAEGQIDEEHLNSIKARLACLNLN